MTTSAKQESRTNAMWEFFSSVKLTILLLSLLAIASVAGTLIPQAEEAVDFARALTPRTLRLFTALDLFDVYHSPWFRLLIGLLTLNLVTCSIDRFPATWKRFRTKARADRRKPFENLPPEQGFVVNAAVDSVAASAGALLRKQSHESVDADGEHFFLLERGRYAHFGFYLVHLSILLILAGGLVGSFFGLEGYVNIAEGEQVNAITLRGRGTPHSLGFEVRCERFLVEFYENGAPKEYRSDLRFSVNGQEIQTASVRVNHPVEIRGVTFYQHSYGSLPGNRVQLRIETPGSGEKPAAFAVKKGESVPLPGKEGQFQVLEIRRLGAMPAALISVQASDGPERQFWVFQNFEALRKQLPAEMIGSEKFNPSAFAPYTFFLDGQETRYYTGLEVNRDPGVPLVWLGCFLMVGGFFLTFFASHRTIRVRVSASPAGSRVEVAGSASKNPVGLQRELERLTRELRKRCVRSTGKDRLS